MSTRAPFRRYDSVQQDWRSLLPETKATFFETHTRELENAYLMLSISLNEAIDLRDHGQHAKACQAIGITPELCALLAQRIDSILHSMRQQARHFAVIPNLAPLEPANFRTERGQRAARFSSLLSHVLLSERSQFLHKVCTLEQIADELGDAFIESVQRLENRSELDSSAWRTLDFCHFDLNTCLRETVVLFKSFLVVLPEEQLSGLDFIIRGLCRIRRFASHAGSMVIEPRRISVVAGK